MNRTVRTLTVLVVLSWVNSTVAEDATKPTDTDLTGNWTFTYSNKSINDIKLKLERGKLTGFWVSRFQGDNRDMPIERARFKDGKLSFSVILDNPNLGAKVVVNYTGIVSGDTIKGNMEIRYPTGQSTNTEYVGKRYDEVKKQ